VSEDRAQQNTAAEEAPVGRRGRDELLGAPERGRERAAGEEPDVLLDVSELEVDRITLEVEGLRAHVSVLAELANLLSLSVGVDARLDRVKLEIEGVEAQVLLKVRLEHVRAILEKALDTIAEHPEILRILARSISELVRERLGEALGTLDEILEGLEVGDTVDEVLKGRLEETRATLEEILERQGGIEGEVRGALGEAGRTVRRTVDESGTIVEQTLDESGEVSAEAVVGEEAERTQNEVQATPAAKRKAEELGVDLTAVEGTGSGGRITVGDVQKAAQEE
jgi:pyruvate/2-oxoglutarate dehydrogenase complex dihydrolipoamide acyltransferase (E2) component